MTNEHRIIFQQDDVIKRTLNQQLPGLLPPSNSSTCDCVNTFVKLERKPLLKYNKDVEENGTQTAVELADVACQTIDQVSEKLAQFDASVQTIDKEMEQGDEKDEETSSQSSSSSKFSESEP